MQAEHSSKPPPYLRYAPTPPAPKYSSPLHQAQAVKPMPPPVILRLVMHFGWCMVGLEFCNDIRAVFSRIDNELIRKEEEVQHRIRR